MNFFDGRVTRRNGKVAEVTAQGLGMLSVAEADPALVEGSKVQVAIRPEKIDLGTIRPEGGGGHVKGTLENAAYLGERSHFYVRIDGLDRPVAVSAQNRAGSSLSAGQSSPVWLRWDDSSVVLLTPG